MPEVYLNELSCRGSVPVAERVTVVNEFVERLKELHKRNVKCIYTHLCLDHIRITSLSSIKDIITSDEFKKDSRLEFALGFFNVIHPKELSDVIEGINITEAKVNGNDSVGLTVASDAVKNECALSLSGTGWDNKEYRVDIVRLGDDCEEIQELAIARNISKKNHFDDHSSYLPLPPEKKYRIGKVLERELNSLFPNLIFRDAARKFVKNCTSGDMVEQIYIKLKELQKVAQLIGSDTLKPELFNTKTTPDSVTRNNMLNLNFRFEDGITRNCEWHMRFTPGAGRIHFSRDEAPENVIYVGYIGDKIV